MQAIHKTGVPARARIVRCTAFLRPVLALGVALSAAAPGDAIAQDLPVNGRLPGATTRVKLSGPRVGITFLSDGVREKIRTDRNITLNPVITQFGWQFERQFLGDDTGLAAISEIVLLAGGLDQGRVIPSASWLVGLRTVRGTEFGVGPNVTPAGVALAIAAGVTVRRGTVNIPFSLSLLPSQSGTRVSVLTGFTVR